MWRLVLDRAAPVVEGSRNSQSFFVVHQNKADMTAENCTTVDSHRCFVVVAGFAEDNFESEHSEGLDFVDSKAVADSPDFVEVGSMNSGVVDTAVDRTVHRDQAWSMPVADTSRNSVGILPC